MKRVIFYFNLFILCTPTIMYGVGTRVELPSAKQALQMANDVLDAPTQGQVILIEGSHSDSDLRPRIWDLTFFDRRRLNDGTVVRIKDGAVVSVASSVRIIDDTRWRKFGRNFSGYKGTETINLQRLVFDSDQIIASVTGLPKLHGYQITEIFITIRKLSDGDVPPIWRIRVRARPRAAPWKEHWIGYLQFNGETGDLISDELRLGRPIR